MSAPSLSADASGMDRPASILRRPLHVFIAALLLLSASETDALLGLLLGIGQLRFVSIAFLGLLALYVLLNFRSALALVARPLIRRWMLLLVAAPISITAIQILPGYQTPEAAIYWIGVILLTGLCFFAAMLWARKSSDDTVRNLIGAALTISFAGFLIQYVNYDLLRETMLYSSNVIAASASMPRLMGFYSHPNFAALSLLALTLPLLTAYNGRDSWTLPTLALVLTIAAGILATGSRTSLLILALAILAFTAYSTLYVRRWPVLTRDALAVLVFLTLAFPLALILRPHLADQGNAIGLGLLRMGQLLGAFSPDGTGMDASAAQRAAIVGPYIALSLESPLIGHGHHWLSRTVGSPALPIVSQNSWVQWLAEYGYPFVFFALYVFLSTFATLARLVRRDRSPVSRSAFALLFFMAVMAVAMFSINDIFFIKSVVIVFGLLTGTLVRHWSQARREAAR